MMHNKHCQSTGNCKINDSVLCFWLAGECRSRRRGSLGSKVIRWWWVSVSAARASVDMTWSAELLSSNAMISSSCWWGPADDGWLHINTHIYTDVVLIMHTCRLLITRGGATLNFSLLETFLRKGISGEGIFAPKFIKTGLDWAQESCIRVHFEVPLCTS